MFNSLTRRNRAFTLIELLVVIAIIALLIGTPLPTSAQTGRAAALAVQASNFTPVREAAVEHGPTPRPREYAKRPRADRARHPSDPGAGHGDASVDKAISQIGESARGLSATTAEVICRWLEHGLMVALMLMVWRLHSTLLKATDRHQRALDSSNGRIAALEQMLDARLAQAPGGAVATPPPPATPAMGGGAGAALSGPGNTPRWLVRLINLIADALFLFDARTRDRRRVHSRGSATPTGAASDGSTGRLSH